MKPLRSRLTLVRHTTVEWGHGCKLDVTTSHDLETTVTPCACERCERIREMMAELCDAGVSAQREFWMTLLRGHYRVKVRMVA